MRNILFVCSGNICRSPMAEFYFRHRAAEEGLEDLRVESAGTLRIQGAEASAEAVAAMQSLGIDLSKHRSQGLREEHVQSADWIIVMDYGHLDYLAARHPESHGRRFLLRAFESGPSPTRDPREFADPMGEPVDFYLEQLPLLRRCVDHMILYLRS